MALLNISQIAAAMALLESDIKRALARNGYEDADELLSAECAGMTHEGTFVYNITFTDANTGLVGSGRIYVHYTNNGTLVADY